MISFLAPFALAGLATLAVPIIVHLFKPRRVRVVPFSSLRWLRASQHRLSRRIRWHQVLLFLLRAAILSLLVLAVARPVLVGRGGGETVHRFVVVDAGRAMLHTVRGTPEPMETVSNLAGHLLSDAAPGRPVTAMIVGHTPQALGPLTEVPGRYDDTIRNLRSEGAETPVSAALRLVSPLRRNVEPSSSIELTFLTANLASSWNQADIASFMRESDVPVRVRIVETAPSDPRNAWIASAEVREARERAAPVIRVRLHAVGDRAQTRTLRISGIDGMPEARREVSLPPGRGVWQEFELPPMLTLDDRIAVLSLDPPDAMPDDDLYWLPLSPRGQQKVLVVEPESTRIRELRPAFHLLAALETLSESQPGRLSLESRTPETLRTTDLSQADLVFLLEPPALSEAQLEALRDRISGGAGLVVFLGPATDAEFYNHALFNPLQPSEGLVTRELGVQVNVGAAGQRTRMSGLRWDHPLLSPFVDPAYGDLSMVGFNAYRLFAATLESDRERVLASFPDRTPALIESSFGVGRVLLFNTTANDAWSDLPRRRGFVPLLDGVLSYLTGPAGSGRFRVGESVRLTLPPAAKENSVRFLDPEGRPLRADTILQGGRRVLRIAPVAAAGVYSLEYETERGDKQQESIVVQTGRASSPMAGMDPDVLQNWWEPAEIEIAGPGATPAVYGYGMPHGRLAAWLVALAILAFLTETVLCSRLCPRAKPAIVSDSVISRRGFFVRRMEAGHAVAEAAGEARS